jgi:hypothetical protein
MSWDLMPNFSKHQHIKFKNTIRTKYALKDNAVCGNVRKSSSALAWVFDDYIVARSFIVEYSIDGKMKKFNAKTEKTQDGDDFYLRIGLMLRGPSAMIPLMAPAWIRSMDSFLKLETNKMHQYVFNSVNRSGAEWESPESSSIQMFASRSSKIDDTWQRAAIKVPKTQIAGVWLMMDGDNSGSKFTTCIRRLSIRD